MLQQPGAPPSAERARRVTEALRSLSRMPVSPQSAAALAPALPVLAHLLTASPTPSEEAPPDAEVLENVCAALASFSGSNNGQVQAVLDAGCLPAVVQLLSHGELEVRRHALRVAGNVACGDDSQTEQLLAAGALPLLRRLLEDAAQPQYVHKEVCWTLSNITAGTAAQKQAMFDEGLIPLLVATLASPDPYYSDVRKEAAWALSNASEGSHAQVDVLVDAGVIVPMCDMLSMSRIARLAVTDARVVLAVLAALENILRVGACERDEAGASVNGYAVRVSEAGGVDKLEALQNHASSEVREKAAHIVEAYFWVDAT